ncbi:hypothetical protein QYF36_024553 [Acer negundo]|nr:hypothetical protein QYF36_024553 [Acer negundo]
MPKKSHAFRESTTNNQPQFSRVLHYSYRLDGVKLSGGNFIFSINMLPFPFGSDSVPSSDTSSSFVNPFGVRDTSSSFVNPFGSDSVPSSDTSSRTPSQSTTNANDYSLQSPSTQGSSDGSSTQGSSHGIYEDHPGLDPSDEGVVEWQSAIYEKFEELMPGSSQEAVMTAAESARKQRYRNFFLLVQTISVLLYHTPFLFILPSELNLLEGYLNEAQDPEWVEFVRQRLQIQNHAPRIYESLVRDFINTELCFSTRDKICSMYKLLFYSREDQKFWVDPIDLDCILHVHLEGVEFNLPALHQVLTSLSTEGHESTFYSQVKTRHAHHFHGFLALKEKAALEMQQDLELRQEWIELEKKRPSFKSGTRFLKEGSGFQNDDTISI